MVINTGFNVDDYLREDRVHGRVYTDQTIFDLEMEQIFGRSWVYVAHESEVSNPGDYKATRIGLQPIVVTRDADSGEIFALYNRCRHRAATVCQNERGNANYFRCAYHGWTYNNRGDLVGVPYRQGYGADFNYAEFGLVRVPRLANYRGFLFASLSPEGQEFGEWLGNARLYIDRFVDLSPEGEIEVLPGGHKYGYDGNWKFQTENTADNYHVDFTHTTLRDLYKRRKALNGKTAYSIGPGRVLESRLRDLGHGHSVNDRPYGQTLLELAPVNADVRRYLAALEERLGPEGARDVVLQGGPVPFTFRMFPNLVLIQSQIRVIFPVSPGRTEVWSTPTRLKGAPDEVNAMRIRYHEDLHGPAGFGSPDDTEMFERNQRGLQAKGDEWLVMSRGLGREETDEHGNTVGEIISETGLRAIWREWKRLMTAGQAGNRYDD